MIWGEKMMWHFGRAEKRLGNAAGQRRQGPGPVGVADGGQARLAEMRPRRNCRLDPRGPETSAFTIAPSSSIPGGGGEDTCRCEARPGSQWRP